MVHLQNRLVEPHDFVLLSVQMYMLYMQLLLHVCRLVFTFNLHSPNGEGF